MLRPARVDRMGMMEFSDGDVLDLLNWRPDNPAWRSEWMDLYGRCPAGGWRSPSPEWIEWVRNLLKQPADPYGQEVIVRLLCAAGAIHPQGLERQRLQEALLAVGHAHGRDYHPADGLVKDAERGGVIRTEEIEQWHRGMSSGSGWKTFCRLTIYGKSLVKATPMPEPFPPLPPEKPLTPPPVQPARQPATDWWARQLASRRNDAPVPPAASGSPEGTGDAEPLAQQPAPTQSGATPTISDDFVWAAPFVDQQVRKFFRKHSKEYTQAVQDVVNGQLDLRQFGLDFGPRQISDWINKTLGVRDDHPKPCTPQSVNGSATYEALVKTFKRNPRQHAIVKRLQEGESDQTQAILDEFLSDEGPAL
jgi:hypothetical protein